MDVLVDRCAALDVHKDQVTACVRRWAATGRRRESETRTFSTMLASLRVLRAWLASEQVTVVAMEATYWKPVVRHEALTDREGVKGPLLWAVAAAC